MLVQTLKVVSYLLFSLLLGFAVTLLTDNLEDVTVEKKIRANLENNIKNALSSFKESAAGYTSGDEKKFVKKFVGTVMKDKVLVLEHDSAGVHEKGKDRLFLFRLAGTDDRALDFYIQENYLRSELAILDVPDYLSGIIATIIVFTFIVFYTESRKRARSLKQQFEVRHAELSSALRQHEALALLGRMSAALAHEIKTPIATISNLVQAFPGRQTDEQFVKRFLALIRDEVNRTQQLIDNLFAYGKEIVIRNNEWIPLEPFLKTVSGGMRLDVPQRFMIFGDRFYLDLLFKNLFRNSREAGADTVSVSVSVNGMGPDGSHAEIICEDNGAGFPPAADMEKLTEPFVTSRSRGGGLGLYLAKKIVTAHGGSIFLARREKGARVTITFPANRIKS